ncbi:MAG TPA: TetR family transcriptional regulator C-terminal domain-containing protein, partial [Dongiaceae bacterium]
MATKTARKAKPRFTRETPEERRRKLVEAAIRCLGREGMPGFKVERICAEAKVSLGLLNHYFSSKDELLIAVYRAALYEDTNEKIAAALSGGAKLDAALRLSQIVDTMIDPAYLRASNLNVWLALWSEIVVNPRLKRAHRTLYHQYIDALAKLIQAVAKERKLKTDAPALARNLTALVDGLFLECALDRKAITYGQLRQAAYDWLELHLG